MDARRIIASRRCYALAFVLLSLSALAEKNSGENPGEQVSGCKTWVQQEAVALGRWESSKLRAHRQARKRLSEDQRARIARTNDAVVIDSRLQDVEITTGDTKAGYHRRFRAIGTFDVTLRSHACGNK